MKIGEVSERFSISISKLKYYEKMGLLNNVRKVNNIRDYEDKDIHILSIIITLSSAGADTESLKQYLQLLDKGSNKAERKAILKKLRFDLLEEIHSRQKLLDQLDYLIYEIDKK